MATKHDGKRAQANMWVTHQNLARAKGGRSQYQHKVPRLQKAAVAPPVEPATSEEPCSHAVVAEEPEKAS